MKKAKRGLRASACCLLAAGGLALCWAASGVRVDLRDQSSLVRVGMDPHPTDSSDIALAYTLLGALDHNHPDSIRYVRDAWQAKADRDATRDKAYSSLAYILGRTIGDVKAPGEAESKTLENLLTEDLYSYFAADGHANLKKYLTLKYGLNNYRPRSVKEFIAERTLLEDLLMFNDPNRNQWDCTDTVMALLPLKKGQKAADIGCGFGFNSVRLRNLTGKEGQVYATDTEKAYTDHFGRFLESNSITGITPVNATGDNISVDDTLDLVLMSSLYHIIYTWSREDERKAFLTSLNSRLRQGGHLAIVDNLNLHGRELNNCHVDPRLVEIQLGYWGYRPKLFRKLSDQRYLSIFERDSTYRPTPSAGNTDAPHINVESGKSVVHIGSLDSYDITDRGIDAAQYVYDFLEGGDESLAKIAIEKYKDIIPRENFGGEYTALQWLCEAMTAPQAKKDSMLAGRLTRSFYETMTADSARTARYYLLHKYKLGNDSVRMLSDSLLELSGEVGRTHRSYLEDYILALNPRRPQWENTEALLERLGIEKGDTIADIGSGSGFFTDKFSDMTGPEGHVYALELKDEHIKSLQGFLDKEKIGNVTVIKGREDLLELPRPVDKMFMCSLYHIMYGVVSDADRDAYLKSLVTQLKPGGELIIVDNGPVDDDTLPYHGPYISPELITTQLAFYGFEPVDFLQFIPQRYMLKFKLREQGTQKYNPEFQ